MEALRGPRGWIVEVRRAIGARLSRFTGRGCGSMLTGSTLGLWRSWRSTATRARRWAGWHRCQGGGETLDVELRPD